MTEQSTIDRITDALGDRLVKAFASAGVADSDSRTVIDRAADEAFTRFVLAALRAGDELPGGMVVISRSQLGAMVFAKTQSDATGRDQREVNAIVRDTLEALTAPPKGGA